MSKRLNTPVCSCCGRIVEPTEAAVHFVCPDCGKSTIWRCETCRNRGNTYTCVSWGFNGP